MKRAIALLLVSMLVLTLAPWSALAAPSANPTPQGNLQNLDQGNTAGGPEELRLRNETEARLGNETLSGYGNQTELRFQNTTENRATVQNLARNSTELHLLIQERQQELAQTVNQSQVQNRQVLEDQNRVRLAVHTFLLMKDELPGIGPNVSAIAMGFNNSVEATIRAEERIQERNTLVRFFLGGDAESADVIDQQVVQNRDRIQQLTQLEERCSCSDDVKVMLREQLQNMTQEQDRLQTLAANEKADKGLLGWLWR
ncbi:MAG TPA: hypothetical protein VE134_05325 [Methanomicrobiales archaeon]|nr:hypothetical protein [Methanomicrobiales archaeon]